MNPNVLAALITGVFAVIVFILTQYYRDKNRRNPPVDTPLAPTTTAEMWEHIQSQDGRLEKNAAQIAQIRTELDEERSARIKFTEAVRRYLEQLAAAWPGPGTMPNPADSDLDILQTTLPRNHKKV